ncbi:MAG: archaellin/type IV pilin N-terminal domain-containing protein [Nanobdellota archaeon]
MKARKAEMGIGTLIIFIALLLVAAIAAGVLVQTSGSLQEKALTTGDQAKSQISTNVRVVEISATDGRDGSVRDFTHIVKLAPGSDPMKLGQSLLTINTFDRTASLQYAGATAGYEKGTDGYYTWNQEVLNRQAGEFELPENDYEQDGLPDKVSGGRGGAPLYLNLSNSTDVVLGNCTSQTFQGYSMATSQILKSVDGQCNSSDDVLSVTLMPQEVGTGVFAAQYLQIGPNHVEGNLQRGDVIKFYYEAPRDVSEDEDVRINFIPKVGTSTLTEFITPNVISSERVYLYP